jgi:nucleoside-diphosphate-sugar epimerase
VVLLNLGLQTPNTLLHDGHAWKRYSPARIVGDTRAVLADPANRDVAFIVHASYAFLRAADGAPVGPQLRPIVDAALEAEALVLGDARPACVLRLGYLYGPESADLKAYRLAFRIGRPYWSGPRSRLQHHLHTADAAAALLRAARGKPRGRLLYATDDRPASFAAFMDHFARLIGNPLPAHLPQFSRPLARIVVAQEHMEMVKLGVRGPAQPQLGGFRPNYPDYRAGLAQVVEAWR